MRQEVGPELERLEAEAVDEDVRIGDTLCDESLIGHWISFFLLLLAAGSFFFR